MTGCGRNSVILDGYTVEAIMCSLNEAQNIADSLESALHQCLIDDNPNKVTFTLADSSSDDGTQDIARSYGVRVLNVPRGKLNARDQAIRRSTADFIISLDADTIYPYGFYARLIKHFENPEVVAVSGLQKVENPIGEAWRGVTYWSAQLGLTKWMMGGASAFKREAYIAVGGFNLGINQKEIRDVWWEEEMQLGWKLSQLGKYVFEPKAVAQSSSRRWDMNPEFWQRVGRDTF